MIVGLGSDLIDIDRIERTLERFGERFTRRSASVNTRPRIDLTITDEPPLAHALVIITAVPEDAANSCA